jgi:hypothetical protein
VESVSERNLIRKLQEGKHEHGPDCTRSNAEAISAGANVFSAAPVRSPRPFVRQSDHGQSRPVDSMDRVGTEQCSSPCSGRYR